MDVQSGTSPSRSNPRLQEYLSQRTQLVQDEKSTRADAEFKKNLSPTASRACEIVDKIRDEELRTVWTADVEEAMAADRHEAIFPGMMFMLAKERLERTRLWKIVRRMPKGCLLHSHMDAVADFEYLLEELIQLPGMHMSSDRPLATHRDRQDARLDFRYKAQDQTNGSVWNDDYEVGTFILLTNVAGEFLDGGREGFLKWLYSRCRLSLSDSHEQHHGIDAIWTKFEKCFSIVGTITRYEPMLRCLLRRMMSVLKADGVNWIETRLVPIELQV
jgi:adenosine deaminase CECR1